MFDGEIYHASMMQTIVWLNLTRKRNKKHSSSQNKQKNVGLIKSCDEIVEQKTHFVTRACSFFSRFRLRVRGLSYGGYFCNG